MQRPFWVDAYEQAVDGLMVRMEIVADRTVTEGGSPGDLLDRVLKDLGGRAHSMLRGRLIDAGWSEKAGVWSHPDFESLQVAA